jgi:predicted CXXCH cytochrome family protein
MGTEEPTDTLDGGNFWWVKGPATGDPEDPNYWTGGQDDTKGHNIFPGEDDDNYDNVAPGNSYGTGCGLNSCHDNLHGEWTGMFGTRQGCTSCHMIRYEGFSGFHHADDTVTAVVGADIQDPLTDPDFDGFFRFLSGKCSGVGHGVCGIEDDDWQATSSTDHNEYLEYQSTGGSAGSLSSLGHTMTGFCSGCHGNFHIRKCYGEEHQPEPCYGDWIRHGAGVELCPEGLDGCEMAAYTLYDPQTPVGRPSLDGWTQPSGTVNPATDMANCLSCHRAHGSPYPKMLRWDMTDRAGACATCHTSLKIIP